MQDFWFYLNLGVGHVLDINAYDHILFLAALALPFTFKSWKSVVLLATVFTVTHCLSLALSTYGVVEMDVELIEFLIPVTIALTAIFNLVFVNRPSATKSLWLHTLATAFFGLIHGFGFSNYFKMLMAEIDNKVVPLLGFASGIEVSQVVIVLSVLTISYFVISGTKLSQKWFVVIFSSLILLLTIPMLVRTFPV
ncbi:HupE/UreJ family protein [Pseudozobellia thermophila]|uniref:HupE / UreJ protein n=1 Tax=Pseudozobellia thermophila TaxID=192903 RepID=A0A1M6C0K1_9FLAO|nr:HupE/UreJ family protein [Pseudozobellia thermophila]SHI54443.1 HupE / UreJ protein [Pseudozobellia thermophila]